jgi:2-succinyl-6-hydroxy-2,4-cyclohexadiene-1-carboxylate synthase
MKKLNLIFLHGTLQRASVWNDIICKIKKLPESKNIIFFTPDLYEDNPDSIKIWLKNLDTKISTQDNNILIGYSLGGRFALSLYEMDKNKYQSIILICTDPGLEDSSKKELLIKNDIKWAERFQTMNWEVLLNEWDKLPVFANIPNPVPPKEADFNNNTFSRNDLRRLWIQSSKANNTSLWHLIPKVNKKSLIITGELDTKFDALGCEIQKRNPRFFNRICFKNTGHRVPWERMDDFLSALMLYLIRINLLDGIPAQNATP